MKGRRLVPKNQFCKTIWLEVLGNPNARGPETMQEKQLVSVVSVSVEEVSRSEPVSKSVDVLNRLPINNQYRKWFFMAV